MAELEIREERDRLGHAHIPIDFETDIGYGPSRQYQTHYIFCDNIQPWCLKK